MSLLSGYRIVESSMLLNGASTAMMLVDLGADVIKIESPFLGDYLRIEETMHLHRQTNKGKRSVALDLRKPEGREILQKLIGTADVFVTNAVADKNRKIGLAYDQLTPYRSDLIYCQNTGFGATGPYAQIPAHGQMMDSLAGAMPVEMGEDGLTYPTRRYSRRTGSLASAGEGTAAGAVYAAFHIAAALAHRAKTGEGAYIDVSSADAVIASAWIAACIQLNDPARATWWQNEDNVRPVARYQSYETRDRKFVLFCPEEPKFWHAFCDFAQRPDLKERTNGIELRREIQAIFHTRDREDWIHLAVKRGFPLTPINDGIEEVRNDPQISSRNIFIDASDEQNGPFTYIGQPACVNGRKSDILSPAPALGQHTDEVLGELGYTAAEIERLAAERITTAAARETEPISRNLYGNH